VVGLIAGGILAWLFMRNRVSQAQEAMRIQAESERAGLLERLQGREGQIEELKRVNEKMAMETDRLREEIRTESERRSAAEERNARIPELEMLTRPGRNRSMLSSRRTQT